MRTQLLNLSIQWLYPALFNQSMISILWPTPKLLSKTLSPNSLGRWIWGFLSSPHSATLPLNPPSVLQLSVLVCWLVVCIGQGTYYSFRSFLRAVFWGESVTYPLLLCGSVMQKWRKKINGSWAPALAGRSGFCFLFFSFYTFCTSDHSTQPKVHPVLWD